MWPGSFKRGHRGKWSIMKKKKVLFHQDKTLRHSLMKTMTKVHELHLELLPYSPDLAPCEFCTLHRNA